MNEFRAIVVTKPESGYDCRYAPLTDDDLMDGDVTVRVEWSTVNYKDGLAITGRAPVVRRFPMVPGIDFAGTVETSCHRDWSPGDKVILNGWGTGESHLGAFAEKTRVNGDWLVRLPDGLSTREAMAIGTAGLTAMLCVMAIERHGIRPDRGLCLVTGAAGGVGSVAIALMSGLGFEVIASTGRLEERDYLEGLGAAQAIARSELAGPGKPLMKERWACGIDTIGSNTLANALASTRYGGAIAACGLAGGMDLPASVAPFILRNVALLGVDSVMAQPALRREAWSRLAAELDRAKLATMTNEIDLDDVIETASRIIKGEVRGRVIVRVGRP